MDATTMELDDLKSAWQSLDRRLQLENTLKLEELRGRKADRARGSLRPLFWGQCVQMLFGVAVMLMGVACWSQHRDFTLMLVSGLVMHAYGLLTVVSAGVVLGMIGNIDFGQPVLAIQERLARLRHTYMIAGRIVGLPWWVLWMPMLAVLVGLENSQLPPGQIPVAPWIWASLSIGALGLLATWAFHRWAHHPRRAQLGRRLDEHAAGSSIRKAQAQLDELRRFEQE